MMKEKLKNKSEKSKSEIRSLFFLLFSLFIFLLFFGCNDGQYNDFNGPKPKAGYGLVSVTARGMPSRTVIPTIAFAKEECTFTNMIKGETLSPEPVDGYFMLELGVWQASVKVYINTDDTEPAATGISDVFNVTSEAIARIVIQLTDSMTGTGSFSYSITYPDNAQITAFTLKNLFSGANAVIDIDESEEADGSNIVRSGTITANAGYNYLTIELLEDGTEYRTAGTNEIVLIYPDMYSEYSASFTTDDFSHIHKWRDWDSTATETDDGVETRACEHIGTHREERIAYATGTPGLYFESTDSSTYRLIQCLSSREDVYIPAMHRSGVNSPYLPVTEISYDAFQRIGYYDNPGMPPDMFSITSITIPATVKSIGVYYDPYMPGNPDMPPKMDIDRNIFTNCNYLQSITVNSGNPNYASDGGVLYNKAKTKLIAAPMAIENINIPESVTIIGDSAFYGCRNLKNITLPSGLTSIGNNAFYDCDSLVSIDIPSSVTSIESHAFNNCDSLEKIYIPASVTTIGQSVFGWCRGLTSIEVNGGNPNYTSRSGILYNKAMTELIAVPQKISGTVDIPSGVTIIGDEAFSGCGDLTGITLPNSVTSIGNNAFSNCTSLNGITIPSNVTSIGYGAFHWCTEFTSISIPASVIDISNSAFSGCSSLASISVAAGNPNYSGEGGILFNKNKTELLAYPSASGNVTIPAGVTSIGDSAFYNTSDITGVSFPASLKSIGHSAFSLCHNITSLIIPASVTFIGGSAFFECRSLTSVTFSAGSSITGHDEYGQDNFGNNAFPEGNYSSGNNLKMAYLAYGAGTYTRAPDGYDWKKQ